MSMKRTQQFLYFQNRAIHYDHLKKIKPTIDNRRSKSSINHNSIDIQQLDKYNNNCKKKITPIKQFQLQQQNLGIINRIVGIIRSPKTQIEKTGYSRFNQNLTYRFTRSNFKKQEQKINLINQNRKFATKLIHTKPSIGTIDQWNDRYQQVKKHQKQISHYDQTTNSRGSFDIYTDRNFMPTYYKNFLQKKGHNRRSINYQISRDQLYQLPKLNKNGTNNINLNQASGEFSTTKSKLMSTIDS